MVVIWWCGSGVFVLYLCGALVFWCSVAVWLCRDGGVVVCGDVVKRVLVEVGWLSLCCGWGVVLWCCVAVLICQDGGVMVG